MTKETPKQRGKYFRSGNTLMRNNEDGTFSSSYIAEFYDADIPELDEMIAKLNTHANLMEAAESALYWLEMLDEREQCDSVMKKLKSATKGGKDAIK